MHIAHIFFSLAAGFGSSLSRGLAYLDPGSGSFILQLLIAGLLGGAFIVKTYWRKIISFFRGQPQETEKPEQKEE